MQITHLSVNNYKSLRWISITPGEMTALVGANAAGKTNITDCIDFLSEIYGEGLEAAVAKKGGYENISFRRVRRSRSPIELSISAQFDIEDSINTFLGEEPGPVTLEHTFSFKAISTSIKAEYRVITEEIKLWASHNKEDKAIIQLKRNSDGKVELSVDKNSKHVPSPLKPDNDEYFMLMIKQFEKVSSSELLLARHFLWMFPFSYVLQELSNIRVFQINPIRSRQDGVPTPRAELERYGTNLPTVIDTMKRTEKKQWTTIMNAMRTIVPNLESIDVAYAMNKLLVLQFREKGFGRAWSANEISDGTLQTLALLVAIYDQRISMLILEEIENSIHPWIIRHILDACREASQNKQIIITTHSPVVMNCMKPEEIWVVWRQNGGSNVSPLTKLDPSFREMWGNGDVSTFDYLDSGAEPKAIPPDPSEIDTEESEK
ncbi:recombination protein F [bacterium BMS3Bbin04]|nr:recombination protein F [bacterium BMS3Bbin04]